MSTAAWRGPRSSGAGARKLRGSVLKLSGGGRRRQQLHGRSETSEEVPAATQVRHVDMAITRFPMHYNKQDLPWLPALVAGLARSDATVERNVRQMANGPVQIVVVHSGLPVRVPPAVALPAEMGWQQGCWHYAIQELSNSKVLLGWGV